MQPAAKKLRRAMQGRELVAQALKLNRAFDATAAKEAESLLLEPVATR